MAISTSSDISGFFNDLYEQALFVLRQRNLMANLVTNYTGSGMGQRKAGLYPQITARTVAEGTDFATPTTWAKSAGMDLTPVIKKSQTIVTQSMIDTDPDDTLADAGTELGNSISTAIDEDLLALFSSFSTGKGTANSALTLKIAGAALSVLINSKAMGPYYYVLHPYQWHDLWVELGQPAANQAFLGDTANEAMRQYAVAQFNGATWFTSANIDVDSSDDAVGAVFTREALALDTRKAPTMAVDEDPSIAGYGYELNMEAWYAVGIRRNNNGVKITSDATEPTGA